MRRPLTKEEWRMGYTEDMRPCGCATVAAVAFAILLVAMLAMSTGAWS